MSQKMLVPNSQEQVIKSLLEIYNELPKQLKIAARFIIDNPYEIGIQTMRTLATKAKVHPNSFVRLAQQIGFDGYASLRERFRDFVRNGVGSPQQRVQWLQNQGKIAGSKKIIAEMATASLLNLEQMYQNQQIEKLEQAIEWFQQAKKVYVLGVGTSYTLAYSFWHVAKMISSHYMLIPQNGCLIIDDLANIQPNDVLFAMTFQPYRKDVIEALNYSHKVGAKTVGLSDSPTATVSRDAQLSLYAPTHTPQFFHSNTAVMALIESLCALLVAKGGQSATKNIARFSQNRWESGIYET